MGQREERGAALLLHSHLSPPGDTAGWSCPTTTGQQLGHPILLLTPATSCPTGQELLDFLQGYQILPAPGSAGLQGGRKQQEPKAGDGRKGTEDCQQLTGLYLALKQLQV